MSNNAIHTIEKSIRTHRLYSITIKLHQLIPIPIMLQHQQVKNQTLMPNLAI